MYSYNRSIEQKVGGSIPGSVEPKHVERRYLLSPRPELDLRG